MQDGQGVENRAAAIILDSNEKDRLFRAAIRRSLSGLLIFQEDRIIFSNPALREIVGLSEQEILQTNPFDLVHPSDRDTVRQRAADRLQGLSPPDDYEVRILTKEGETRWVRVLATSISWRGSPAVLANILDTTVQRKIEREIRDSEERYRLITDTMSDGLSIQDRNGILTGVNRRLCEMTGFSRDELKGLLLADLLAKKEEKGKKLAAFHRDGAEFTSETFIHHKDGRKVAVALKIEFLVDEEGSHKGSFAFFSDISELKKLRPQALETDRFENIVGREPAMRKLFSEITELAACDFPVLIQGESGVGKELVAQAVHSQSHRSEALFVPVNCGALPEGLLESELFGHVKGAFTGAIRDKKGRFELAHGGTIFLDEVAELSPATQVKLLRILQEGVLERVGDHRSVKVDVRVISATNKNLEREMKAGRFRRDLFYRLCVMPIHVPPLRERRNDILLLADHFIAAVAERASAPRASLSPEALVLLMTHDWPGNVRELQNAVQYACVKSRGNVIMPAHLPPVVLSPAPEPVSRRKRRRKLDREAVRDALEQTGGNKVQAAKLLSVSRATLYRFLDEEN